MRIPLFFYDALNDKEHIALLSKENPKITFQKTHRLSYKAIFSYHSFREKYLYEYKKTPTLNAIKWFNFKFYLNNIFIPKLLNTSIILFLYILGIMILFFIGNKIIQSFELL